MSQKTVPAIVILQPWPWAIFHAPDRKRHENRSRSTSYRGPLVVVAGKGRRSLNAATMWLQQHGQPCPEDLPFGYAVGLVEVTGCLTGAEVGRAIERRVPGWRYIEGPYCHVYANAVAFKKPIPASGNQAIPFRLPLTAELIEQIRQVPTKAARQVMEGL